MYIQLDPFSFAKSQLFKLLSDKREVCLFTYNEVKL